MKTANIVTDRQSRLPTLKGGRDLASLKAIYIYIQQLSTPPTLAVLAALLGNVANTANIATLGDLAAFGVEQTNPRDLVRVREPGVDPRAAVECTLQFPRSPTGQRVD